MAAIRMFLCNRQQNPPTITEKRHWLKQAPWNTCTKEMSDRSAQVVSSIAVGSVPMDVESIRDACVSKQTRGKYKGSLNVIKKWIQEELVKEDQCTDRFFDSDGHINLVEFTSAFFERFLVYKSKSMKTDTLSEYRSAIKDLYRVKRIALPPEYGDDMKQLFSGMKRIEAEQDQTSAPKTSGKQPLTYSLYNLLLELDVQVDVSADSPDITRTGER